MNENLTMPSSILTWVRKVGDFLFGFDFEALKATTVSTQSALAATEAGYEVGNRTLVDVLNSQRDVFRADSALAVSRYDYVLNHLRLKDAAGTITEADLKIVNRQLIH